MRCRGLAKNLARAQTVSILANLYAVWHPPFRGRHRAESGTLANKDASQRERAIVTSPKVIPASSSTTSCARRASGRSSADSSSLTGTYSQLGDTSDPIALLGAAHSSPHDTVNVPLGAIWAE